MINKSINFFKKRKTFIAYTISAGLCFVLDLALFTIFSKMFNPLIDDASILLGTLMARVISSFVNYLMNRNSVFSNKKDALYDSKTLTKYYILVVIQLCVSALSVFIIHKIWQVDATIIKIPIDIIIFIVNYFVQKHFIFIESDELYEVQK